MDAVADRSGVHRTTVYRRGRDVGGLLADVLASATSDDWSRPLYHALVLRRSPADADLADADLAARSAHQVSVAARAGAFARPGSELCTTDVPAHQPTGQTMSSRQPDPSGAAVKNVTYMRLRAGKSC
ncbi:hypothetical protein Strop_2066 [Salinispora tropica CNB-440]|uniref:Uncharacterized protein n=1 Tax=Salinispora tropica (strain ATCC BAA-916 / DSM 44818 / JCM 13857 / NBRC 105044 / CNB-440) TaxID=369723 RepID=A4X6L8_SALTO|nr:hypothetical protein Strop_2066 [Salinispora tropica CNB-440]